MRKFLIIFLSFVYISFGQFDPKIWDNLKTVRTENYEFQVPADWRQTSMNGPGPEQYFEASGLAMPQLYDKSPVIVTIFLVKQECKDLNDCKFRCFRGYKSNPDREFPANFKDGEQLIKLVGGQDAYILNTCFYRQSKGLNQSRFDLVMFSEKAKTGFTYTFSVQYNDPTYKFESDRKLLEFAKKLFSYFKLIV